VRGKRSLMPRRGFSGVTAFVGLVLIYFLAGKLGLKLAFLHVSASPVWPPAGVALGALLVLGYRTWPAIFVGAFLVNVTTAGNFGTSLAIGAGNTLEALCGAWLVNRFADGIDVFEHSKNVFKFAFAAVASTVVSPTIGVTSLALAGFADWARYGAIWMTWWLGDAAGDLIFAPVVILWGMRPRWRWSGKKDLEVGLLLLLLIVLGEAVFGGWFPISAKNYPIAFICGPVVIWLAFRMSQRETATGIFILSVIAIWGTLRNFGPFVMETENQSLLILQAATAVLAITALALAAGMAERRRAEEALTKEKSLVESANRTKDNFLAMLSHELRTPLTPVVAALETLSKQWARNDEEKSVLEMIRRNVYVETRLIDDLLDVTRISKGKLDLKFATLDAHKAVLNVVEICRSEAAAKRIRVNVALRAVDHYVTADEARFQQMIWNLLKNAIKFSREAGQVTISSANESPHQLTITVQDKGVGISPNLIGRIFDPFEQASRSLRQRFGGLGLGLAISKSLAQAHNAALVAKSDGVDYGSTFSVTMGTVAFHSQTQALSESDLRISRRVCRILLVDDHADTCEALKRLLATHGHTVTVRHDMRSALETAQNDQFDLLICDVGLPDASGVELMRRLRGNSSIRGIAISGFGTMADIEKSVAVGFSEHLVKPLNAERLEAAIQTAIAAGQS
jgi:signal transduction histidine kinase/ActR/RegA family two-component response regulator